MSISVHNPDQYMSSLRQIIAQGRKRLGLLVGAGAAASLKDTDGQALIPVVAELTKRVLAALSNDERKAIQAATAEFQAPNIEDILSRTRSLSKVIGATVVHGLDARGYQELSDRICDEIGKIVSKPLPQGSNAYTELVAWISGTSRDHPVELFTTNYDLLFEQALERNKAAYFDGFSGSRRPFFDPASVANNDLPARWTRLWKLHGSLGWETSNDLEVIRVGNDNASHLIFPDHFKYDHTQKAPYSALFDRLKSFLLTPDTLLIAAGFSFADAHVTARIEECLAANPSSSLFAFQYGDLAGAKPATDVATRRANVSVYAADAAMISGIAAEWRPGDPPSRDWGPIRAMFWGRVDGGSPDRFLLGRFDHLAKFFAASRSDQAQGPPPPVAAPVVDLRSVLEASLRAKKS